MKRAAGLFIVCLCFFVPALACAGVDGKELLQKCEAISKLYDDPASLDSKEATGVVYCLGYIDSFIETYSFQRQAQLVPGIPYCFPNDDVPKKQVALAVVDYLKKHSEELSKPASYFIFMGLREAYPCSKKEEEGIKVERKEGPSK